MKHDTDSRSGNSAPAQPETGSPVEYLGRAVENQYWLGRAMKRALAGEAGERVREVMIGPPPTAVRKGTPTPPPHPLIDPTDWWPSSLEPTKPLVPPAGFGTQSLTAQSLPATRVLVFGLRGANLERVVAGISRRQRRGLNFKPVFLTDTNDHAVFREYGYAFEYLPPGVYGSGTERNRKLVTQSRMALINRKWGFAATIDLSSEGDHSLRPEDSIGAPAGSSEENANASGFELSSEEDLSAAVDEIRRSGLFDEEWYLAKYPDAGEGGGDPIRHYLQIGAAKGYDPGPLFSTSYYARQMMRLHR